MGKNTKRVQALLFSAAGLAVLAVLLIIVNMIAAQVKRRVRVDLTADKLYTLSAGSKAILNKLDSPVELHFYCSRNSGAMPVYLKNFASRVEDFLQEYVVASGGKVTIKTFNPTPDSDDEDAARLDGVEGQPLQNGEHLYLGLAVTCVDQTVAIPVLSPTNENNLEYDITRAIYRVTHPDKITIGIVSSLPVMGSAAPGMMNPMMRPPNQQKPWLFVNMLKRDYNVKKIEMNAKSIPDDIRVLLVIHPKKPSDQLLFAIDQFILRGGRVVAMLDPLSFIDAKSRQNQFTPPSPSSLGRLLDTWGVTFDTSKVIVDKIYGAEQNNGQQRQVYPAVLSLDKNAVSQKDIVTSSLDQLLFLFCGAFTGDGVEGLDRRVLVHSSRDSQLVPSFKAQMPGDAINKDFVSDDKEYAIAIQLTGKFKTAFPNGPPTAKGDDKKAAKPDFLKDSGAKPGSVVLISDSDFIYDQFWVRRLNMLGRVLYSQITDNENLLQNIIGQLSGDSNLISIRSRGIVHRPFVEMKKRREKAEAQYRAEIAELEKKKSRVEKRLAELQQTKTNANQKFVLSPAQQKELQKFRKENVETRKHLKAVRKQLNHEINKLELNLKLANIALMPLLIALLGIILGIIRKRREGAK